MSMTKAQINRIKACLGVSPGAPFPKRYHVRIISDNTMMSDSKTAKIHWDDTNEYMISEQNMKLKGEPGELMTTPSNRKAKFIIPYAEIQNIEVLNLDNLDYFRLLEDDPTWLAGAAINAIANQSIIWSSFHEQFISLAHSSTSGIVISPDGDNWIAKTIPSAATWNALAVNEKTGMVLGVSPDAANRILFSEDLYAWDEKNFAEDNNWEDIICANGVFIAVSSSGTSRCMRSEDDGTTWEAIVIPEVNEWKSLAYGNGVVVAVGDAGTQRIMYSNDLGKTWETVVAPEINSWESVAYGNGYFIAVASDGTNRAMKTVDGITWETILVELDSWQSIKCFTKGLDEYFIAISSDGTKRITRTIIGNKWEYFATADVATWEDIAFSPPLNKMVVVASVGAVKFNSSVNKGTNWG